MARRSGISEWLRLGMLAGSVLGLPAAPARSAAVTNLPALESIRLNPLLPEVSQMPSFGMLKWRRERKDLADDQVHEKSRAVSSGMYYVGFVELVDSVAEQKKQLKQARENLAGIPGSHQAQISRARSQLAFAERQLAHRRAQTDEAWRARYTKEAEEARKTIAYYSPELLEEDLANARKNVAYHEERLERLEKMPVTELMWKRMMDSAILNVIGGIQYFEDPDAWLKTIENYDPLFKNPDSAGVGEYSILSPQKHFYNVRFKSGHYVVSLMVTRGLGNEKFETGIHEAGKAIAQAFERALQGPVPGISLEINPLTKEPYEGLVADGENTLGITISLPEARGPVSVGSPSLGRLETREGDEWVPLESGKIALSGSGLAKIRYRPPDYLQKKDLDKFMVIHPDKVENVHHAEVPLVFTYEDDQGAEQTAELAVRVLRPPVVFVHGFTGGTETWEKLDFALIGQLWDTLRERYYFADEGIASQADKLRGDIMGLNLAYQKKNLKARKVDLVVHSMGGLISRYYISLSGRYNDDVRKLIMVATPNHGCSLTEKYLGNASSYFAGYAHWKASDELHENGPVVPRLNQYEAIGGHLHPDVQYGLLYGRRHNYWIWGAWGRDSFYPNDGVVSVDSALLNGVASWRYDGIIHSGAIKAIYKNDHNICEYQPVFDKVKELLLADIPRAELANSDAVFQRVKGDVQVFDPLWVPARNGASARGNWIRTGSNGTAHIHFMQNGGAFAWLAIGTNTRLRVAAASLRHVRVEIAQGSVRFKAAGGEECQAVIEAGKGGQRMTFIPSARILHLETDFDVRVQEDGAVEVFSREGALAVEHWDKDGKTQGEFVKSGTGLALKGDGSRPEKLKKPLAASSPGETESPGTVAGAAAEPDAPPPKPREEAAKPPPAASLRLDIAAEEEGAALAPGVPMTGRLTWKGVLPGPVLQVRIFPEADPDSRLTVPLVVGVRARRHEFRIPRHPAGWRSGRYRAQAVQDGAVLAGTEFELIRPPLTDELLFGD
ncbi:MAG TPA: hypothetical protein PLK81_07360 [Kiritimatiellia bacterium]|nr:hypothetical protein [Kiritimatiellia bacterium]